MENYNLQNILNELNCWCLNYRGVIDSVFTEEFTRAEQISKLFGVVKDILESQTKVVSGFEELYKFVTEFEATVDEKIRNEILEAFSNDIFFDTMILPKLNEAIDRNLICFVSRIAKFVVFGLTDDGHFCVYIPESWNSISFDTGVNGDEYGHLIMKY